MCSAKTFYASGGGDLLIDSSNYPPDIVDYLEGESKLLSEMQDQFDRLAEVGCMEGRHIAWCLKHRKKYLGLDIVSRYIASGRTMLLSNGLKPPDYRMEEVSAERLHSLGGILSERLLFFFPFNSFGNMENQLAVLDSIRKTKKSFLICSYRTTDDINTVRRAYYNNCGYSDIQETMSDEGIRFASTDGLDTMAYHPEYLRKQCEKMGMKLRVIDFSKIGIAYHGSA